MSPSGELSNGSVGPRSPRARTRSAPYPVLRGLHAEPSAPSLEDVLPMLIGVAFAAVVLVQVWLHAAA